MKNAAKNEIIDEKEQNGGSVCSAGCPLEKDSVMKNEIKVNGMMCAHCEARVTKAVTALDGVKSCVASAAEGTVKVEYDESKVSLNAIKDAIKAQDYEVLD